MLPTPDLDDRHFQDFVDDAKRLVQRRCPSWTDHNVSDPGVTLIEAVAQMVDQLVYRLNRVPDLHYVKFLELIGVELRPPAAAQGEVTFWLSSPQPQVVRVRAGSAVATPRTDVEDPVVFTTVAALDVVPCSLRSLLTQAEGAAAVAVTSALGRDPLSAFATPPAVGDALLVGLSAAVPSCAVLLRLDCEVSGQGVDPDHPPLVWEAWTGSGWSACELGSDSTGGLNKPGDVLLHVPAGHVESVVARERAAWLRCRLVETDPGQTTYSRPPTVLGLEASTVGGTVATVNAEVVQGEVLGRSDGTPGQRFALLRRPVVAGPAPTTLTVRRGEQDDTWTEVEHFAQSGPQDRHFRVDAHTGEVQLGPAVRLEDGGLALHGAVPAAGAVLVMGPYRTGGGRRGNVSTGQVRVLKTSVPYVARVENRSPAVGGAEGEDLEDAKVRGPLLLRSRGRAVTASDFEELARDVAPEAARLRCVVEDGTDAGVRLLVVPHVGVDELGRVGRADLDPSPGVLERIARALDERRLVGTRLLVQPPEYLWLTAVVGVAARPGCHPDQVRRDVLRALYRLFDPVLGGPDGTGWPFGRPVQSHEVHAVLARTAGVDMSREVRVALYPAEAGSGRRGAAVDRLDLPPTGLVHSFEHQVRVTA